MTARGFTTRAVHGPGARKESLNAIRFPVYAGVAHDFESAEAMSEAFTGKRAAHSYSRISNPTVEAFERGMTLLEEGVASVALSSGMAAITAVFTNILSAGDSIVAASSLFGGTFSLIKNVLGPLGIEGRFVPIVDPAAVERAIDGTTRAIFLETIANPAMVVPDISAIAEIARARRIPLIADSTVTTPYLFSARTFGVDIAVHSTTKYISGGGSAMGGIIVDLGTFDWSALPALKGYHRLGDMAFIARLRKEVCRETGGCMSPFTAGIQALGLETISLRMDRICRNASRMAEYLSSRSDVRKVHYPGLASSPYFDIARRQFNGQFGGILAFELDDREACFRFLNGLTLIKKAANFGDNRSLAIHPASTIFAGQSAEERRELGAVDSLIRFSAGIEDPEDIIGDIEVALGSAA